VSASPLLSYRDRTIDSMQRLAWPVFQVIPIQSEPERQGGFSTVLGVTVLTFIEAYTINVFYKNVILVIVFGVLHALVFLPVVLDTFMPPLERLIENRIERSIEHRLESL